MATTDEAVASVAETLFQADQDLYVFAPAGKKYFVGEAVIIGAAGILLAAFFRGVQAAAEERLEVWGKSITKWLMDRIQALFEEPQAEEAKKDVKAALDEVLANPKRPAPDSIAQVEAALVQALVANNVPPGRANAIARAVALNGAAVLQGA
jgi:hypothetical protein